LKRIIRESFRLQQAMLGGYDVVVMNKPGAENMNNNELFASLAGHWRACQKAAPSRQEDR
ncbi:MAG: ribonuclease P protein component, partial [Halioglobus sp.]|nr:ribonuclease P protein component [Halioglobus sp.]